MRKETVEKKLYVPFLVLHGNFMKMHESNIGNLAFGNRNLSISRGSLNLCYCYSYYLVSGNFHSKKTRGVVESLTVCHANFAPST